MDQAPHFDRPDHFDQRRIRLADIDGAGATDLIYLAGDGVTLVLQPVRQQLERGATRRGIPGRGQHRRDPGGGSEGQWHCVPRLVVAAAGPRDAADALRRSDGRAKSRTCWFARSTTSAPKRSFTMHRPRSSTWPTSSPATPWITKIPFPVHVVERVETFDRISGNRFVTRYAYHHGYFDGEEREFRGFGMVEQFDTEEYAALSESAEFPSGTNIDESSHVPPVLTRTLVSHRCLPGPPERLELLCRAGGRQRQR